MSTTGKDNCSAACTLTKACIWVLITTAARNLWMRKSAGGLVEHISARSDESLRFRLLCKKCRIRLVRKSVLDGFTR